MEALEITRFYDLLAESIPGGEKDSLESIEMERRLYLEPFTLNGLDEMHSYSCDPRLYQYFTFPPHETLDDTRAYMDKLLQRMGTEVYGRSAMYWFIRKIENDQLIGSIGLTDINYEYQSCEWGFGIDPNEWGKGFILEIEEILKHYVFSTLGLNRLYGKTRCDNKPTLASVLSSGFSQEGVMRQFYRDHKGVYYDAIVYSLLAEEFFRQKSNDPSVSSNLSVTTEKEGGVVEVQAVTETIMDILEITQEDIEYPDQLLSMENVAEWDSHRHIKVIAALQAKYGVQFTPKQVASARSVDEIINIISAAS